MTPGIRSKLVIALILILLIPAVAAGGGFAISMYRLQNSAGNEQLDQMQQINQIVVHEVINGYQYIGNQDRFFTHLKPLLEKYHLELQIESLTGKTFFDSTLFNTQELPESDFIWNRFGGQASRSSIPIVIDNKVVANAVLNSYDPALTGFFTRVYSSMLMSLLLGVLTLMSLVVIFTLYVSKSVLKPLQELNNTAENIAEGNLDHEIKYRAGDELGRFSRTFDQMRLKLKESLHKQQEIETARKEMLVSISHDLRTPIASIKGYVEGLQDGVAVDAAMTNRYLTVIKDKTERLDRLIDDLFRFSRLDLGQVDMHLQQTNSLELLESAFSGYELELGAGRFIVDRPLPSATVKLDRYKIEQVIDNLIQNARRHAGDSSIIGAGAFVQDDRLTVAVRDNGPGIAEHDLPRLFDRFYRGEKSRSRDYGGTGLGLAICKHIVTAHGGDIWVESIRGRGSTFYFSLPLDGNLY